MRCVRVWPSARHRKQQLVASACTNPTTPTTPTTFYILFKNTVFLFLGKRREVFGLDCEKLIPRWWEWWEWWSGGGWLCMATQVQFCVMGGRTRAVAAPQCTHHGVRHLPPGRVDRWMHALPQHAFTFGHGGV